MAKSSSFNNDTRQNAWEDIKKKAWVTLIESSYREEKHHPHVLGPFTFGNKSKSGGRLDSNAHEVTIPTHNHEAFLFTTSAGEHCHGE